VRFVDLARAAAVLLMIQGHTIHVLLAPQHQGNVAFDIWMYVRGLTSCTFLLLSGFSFGLATDRHWNEYLAPTRQLGRRLRRYGFLLVLGYALHIPVKPLTNLARATADQWRVFVLVDILQLVAVTLVALQVGVWVLRTRRRLEVAVLAGIVGIVMATPMTWRVDRLSGLPSWLVAYLSPAEGSFFPLFPWAAYILLGTAASLWFVRTGVHPGGTPLDPTHDARPRAAWLGTGAGPAFLVGGGAMVIAATGLAYVPLSPYGPIDIWGASPNVFLLKAGSVLILLSAFARIPLGGGPLPGWVTALSRESLTVYVVHLALVYGSIWNTGLRQAIGPRLDWPGVAIWVLLVTVAMAILAWSWDRCKRQGPRLAALIRTAVAVFLIYRLL
jgi:uncharacterized membrane protein